MPNEMFPGRRGRDVLREHVGLALALLAAFTISACSMVRVGYEAIPWYASWQFDRYWGLDSAQTGDGQNRIEEFLIWRGITDRQRELVRQMAAMMSQNEQVWFQERLARQQDLIALLERLRWPGQTQV